jgi:16S rRNA (cytosine1402-N4)-methyltransferase
VAEPHRPVLAAEVVGALEPHRGGLYVDGTVGAGGHAAAVLEAGGEGARLLGLDRDPGALELAGRRLAGFGRRARLHLGTFDCIGEALARTGEGRADGILLDLGVSSMQLDNPRRGFSFRAQAPLDMRMAGEGPDAAGLLARLEEDELARLLRELGEEPFARRIARALVRAREDSPIADTARLAALVAEALPGPERRKRKLHPATQVFMALRLAVNDEMGMLERFLERAPGWLAPGGRLAVISYHSLEDRRVKRALAAGADPCTCPPEIGACVCGRRPLYRLPRKKPVTPGPAETAANPRARSARLRVAVRTEAAA